MNELLPYPLLFWYATSGAGGLKQYSGMEFLYISR